MQHKKRHINDYYFAHHTLILLLLHYVVKCKSRSLAIYNNEFILGKECVSSENHLNLMTITSCMWND